MGTKFLDFNQAVDLSELLLDYFNSPQGRPTVVMLGNEFGLTTKENFMLSVSKYEKNCPDCMGCTKEDVCVLGCFKTPSDSVCYWDKALEKILGTKLVAHEMAHVLFEFAYEIGEMSKEKMFETSEKFAQYVENNFTSNLVYCDQCQEFEIEIKAETHPIHPIFQGLSDSAKRIIELSIVFTVATTLSSLITYWFIKRSSKK